MCFGGRVNGENQGPTSGIPENELDTELAARDVAVKKAEMVSALLRLRV